MIKKIHFFDLDGTLLNIHSDIWIIDKDKPYKPILKVPMLEFSLIRNGVYKRFNLPIKYNGETYFISDNMYKNIKKKSKSENLNRFGFSFNNFHDRNILNKSKINYLLDNIEHLRNEKNIDIGILTARSNSYTFSDIINDLRLKLKDMNLTINKIYFVGDKFSVYTDAETSLKKVYVLLEHLIGFKIKNNKFIFDKQDWYQEIHFYDDFDQNIQYANDIQNIFNNILKNSDDEIKSIIINRVNDNVLILNNYLITNNELNRFKTTTITLYEPIKYPIIENMITNFSMFENLAVYNTDKEKKKKLRSGLRNILNDFVLKYVFDYFITNSIIEIPSLSHIEINIFGYGELDNVAKHDALAKLIFIEKNKEWNLKIIKSDVYKIMLKNNNNVHDKTFLSLVNNILKYLKNNKQ